MFSVRNGSFHLGGRGPQRVRGAKGHCLFSFVQQPIPQFSRNQWLCQRLRKADWGGLLGVTFQVR